MLFGRLVSQDCVHHQEVGGNRRAFRLPVQQTAGHPPLGAQRDWQV